MGRSFWFVYAFTLALTGRVAGAEGPESGSPTPSSPPAEMIARFSDDTLSGGSRKIFVYPKVKLTQVQIRFASVETWRPMESTTPVDRYFPFGSDSYYAATEGQKFIVTAKRPDGSRVEHLLTVGAPAGELPPIAVTFLSEKSAEAVKKEGGDGEAPPELGQLNAFRQSLGLLALRHDPVLYQRAKERAAILDRSNKHRGTWGVPRDHGIWDFTVNPAQPAPSWQVGGARYEGLSYGSGPQGACYKDAQDVTFVGTACVGNVCVNIYR